MSHPIIISQDKLVETLIEDIQATCGQTSIIIPEKQRRVKSDLSMLAMATTSIQMEVLNSLQSASEEGKEVSPEIAVSLFQNTMKAIGADEASIQTVQEALAASPYWGALVNKAINAFNQPNTASQCLTEMANLIPKTLTSMVPDSSPQVKEQAENIGAYMKDFFTAPSLDPVEVCLLELNGD